MDVRGYIDVTELDVRALVKAAYAASSPCGLGFLHARDGELDDEMLNVIIERGVKYLHGGVRLDYVHGRAVKFDIRVHEGRRWVKLNWFDHSPEDIKRILRDLKLPDVEERIQLAETGEAEKIAEYERESQT